MREFLDEAFERLDLDWKQFVEIDLRAISGRPRSICSSATLQKRDENSDGSRR